MQKIDNQKFEKSASTGNKSKVRKLIQEITTERNKKDIFTSNSPNNMFRSENFSKHLKTLYNENLKLSSELEKMNKICEIEKSNNSTLMNKLRSAWDEKEMIYSKSIKKMSSLLLEIENLKRMQTIQEISQEKARLGFFSFSNSFGRNMDDWIEGIEIRKMKEEKVILTR
jgi:hypothetical protein